MTTPTAKDTMQILLADDHPLFREGMRAVLPRLDAAVKIIEAKDYPTAFDLAARHADLELALLDLYMPGLAALAVATPSAAVARFRERFPQLPLVVLSAAENPKDIRQLLDLGIAGYLTKSSSSEIILSALRLVLAGGVYVPPPALAALRMMPSPAAAGMDRLGLTERQYMVLRALAHGASNKQIARDLNIAEGTVKAHLSAIFKALQVSSRTEAILAAQKLGLGD